MAHRVVCGVGGVVDDGIGAVTLALDAVGVVPTRGLVFAGHDVPLVDFILSSACNLVAGLTVRLFDVDLQRPLGISHLIGIVRVLRQAQHQCFIGGVHMVHHLGRADGPLREHIRLAPVMALAVDVLQRAEQEIPGILTERRSRAAAVD